MHFGSGLDIQCIILCNRLATAAGLVSSHRIDELGDIRTIINRIICKCNTCNTIQDITISIPCIGKVFRSDARTGGRGDIDGDRLPITNSVGHSDLNCDFRNSGNLNCSGVEADTSSSVRIIALYFYNNFVITSGGEIIV